MSGNTREASMTGLARAGILLACCLLLPQSLSAQGVPPGYGYAPQSPWVAPGAYGAPAVGHPPPADFSPGYQFQAVPYAPSPAATQRVPYRAHDGIVTTSAITDDEWEPGPLELALKQLTQDTWVRVEYLLWEIDEPGDTLLGSPVAGVVNPRAPFPVEYFDPIHGLTEGMARVPSLSDITFRDRNGVRATVGVPMSICDWETSYWMLEKGEASHVARDLPSIPIDDPTDPDAVLPQFVGTSTLINGRLSDNIELYDDSFTATYVSKIWGAETKLVFNTDPPIDAIRLQPMIGFSHLNIQEELRQTGVYTAFDTDPNPVTSEIDSDTKNQIYGPVLGLRTEFLAPWEWIRLGLEPKVLLGIDHYTAEVRTNNFRQNADPEVITREKDLIFSPVLEATVYLQIDVSTRFTFHVGYNVLWAARITRPHDNIYYNDPANINEPPGVVLRTDRQDMTLEGLTIGGVIHLH